jgi:chromosome segregation ATPase
MSQQFEETWPTFEIKIRSLISELLEPSLSKFKSTESMQSKLLKLQQEVKERVQDVESKLNTVNSRIPVVDPINRRVAEQTIRISSFEIDVKGQIEGLRTQLDSYSSSLGSLSSQIYSQSKQNEIFRKSLLDYASGYGTLKKYVEDKTSEIKGEVKQPFELQAEVNVRVENQGC